MAKYTLSHSGAAIDGAISRVGTDLTDYRLVSTTAGTRFVKMPNGSSYAKDISSLVVKGSADGVGDLVESGEHAGEYLVRVVVSGKNLFDGEWESGGIGTSEGNLGQEVELANSIRMVNSIRVIPGQTYYIEITATPKRNIYPFFYRADGTSLVAGFQVKLRNYSWVQTIPEDAAFFRVFQYYNTTPIPDFQIEFGSASTGYQAPAASTEALCYLTEPLRKVGDVCDELDVISGTVTRRIEMVEGEPVPLATPTTEEIGANALQIVGLGETVAAVHTAVEPSAISAQYCRDAASTIIALEAAMAALA